MSSSKEKVKASLLRLKEKRAILNLCFRCGSPIDPPGYQLCAKCRESRREQGRQTRARRKQEGRCSSCGGSVVEGKKSCSECLVEHIARAKDKKIAVISYYGGQCACCFEKDINFLQIDHIKGDGAEHRRLLNQGRSSTTGSGSGFYGWLKANNYPEGFQVLCGSCNVAKGTKSECPHATKRRELEAFSFNSFL